MSTNTKFAYLKKYVDQGKYHIDTRYENCLWSLDDINEIVESEKRLGFEFPSQLKEFWVEIGRGSLPNPHDLKDDFVAAHNNHIFRPKDIADIILLKEESGLILPWLLDYYNEGYLTEDDVPFFEVLASDFLIMKPKSLKPNAIYNMIGEIIEEDFERFIWRLYYESPTYYLDVGK